MFFRRRRPPVPTFSDRLNALGQRGFTVTKGPGGRLRLTLAGCAAEIAESSGSAPTIVVAGILTGSEIATLTDVGYQKVFRTRAGDCQPATAGQLKSLHAFLENLRDGLGLTSLYNESLGTVNSSHHYDRVEDRDRGEPPRPWRRGSE